MPAALQETLTLWGDSLVFHLTVNRAAENQRPTQVCWWYHYFFSDFGSQVQFLSCDFSDILESGSCSVDSLAISQDGLLLSKIRGI